MIPKLDTKVTATSTIHLQPFELSTNMASNLSSHDAAARFAVQLRGKTLEQQKEDVRDQLNLSCELADNKIRWYWLKIREVLFETELRKARLAIAVQRTEGSERARQILTSDVVSIVPPIYQVIVTDIGRDWVVLLEVLGPQEEAARLEELKLIDGRKHWAALQALISTNADNAVNNHPPALPAKLHPAQVGPSSEVGLRTIEFEVVDQSKTLYH
ncbi:hypothetical protein DL546_000482 [Coniochaeta pulveracea]|nr:hypothetical protein DL546_000482 [Coniochaeta pulveracea]